MFELEKTAALNILLIAFAVFTFIYRYWDVFFKSYGPPGRYYYGWTLGLLGAVHSLVGAASVFEYFFLVDTYQWIVGLLAFFIFLSGQLLRNWAIQTLGIFHSVQIEIKPSHRIIQKPPYQYLQHPYYLGVILEVLSTPLVLNAYRSFLIVLALYLPLLFIRIFLEERILARYFGSAYADYQKVTPRFFPRLRVLRP